MQVEARPAADHGFIGGYLFGRIGPVVMPRDGAVFDIAEPAAAVADAFAEIAVNAADEYRVLLVQRQLL